MTGSYYILLPGDDKKDLVNDTNILGEVSFGNFWPGGGFKALSKIINEKPDYIDDIEILSDMGKKLSITEFLDMISKLKVIT
tara:strand:- start:901 stop:1146 length:246 start_codon:yes stop_codon:yes gene_type:complete